MQLASFGASTRPDSTGATDTRSENAKRLEWLFRNHYERVKRWTRVLGVAPDVVEDVTQDVFLTAARRADRLGGDIPQRAWLFGITRRVCANHRRGRRREAARRVNNPVDPAARPASEPDPEQLTGRREMAELFSDFVRSLPEDQRDAFLLFDVEGLTGPEVADALEISISLVHNRVRSARAKLSRIIEVHRARARKDEGAEDGG